MRKYNWNHKTTDITQIRRFYLNPRHVRLLKIKFLKYNRFESYDFRFLEQGGLSFLPMGLPSVGCNEVLLTFVVANKVRSELIRARSELDDSAKRKVEEGTIEKETVHKGNFLEVEEGNRENEIRN